MFGKKYKLSILYVFIQLTIGISVFSQFDAPLIKFDYITTENGLSDNFCECILEDKYGFIWIGTYDGLNKYDGYEFKVYKSIPDDSTTLGSSFIWKIFEDSRGNLWIGTNMGGIALYNYEKDNFRRIYFETKGKVSFESNRINDIIESDNYIWFASMNGLIRYDYEKDKFKWYFHEDSNDCSISSNLALSLLKSSGNNIWIGTSDYGLNYYDYDKDCFIKYLQNDKKSALLSSVLIKTLIRNIDGKIWIGTDDMGVLVLDSTNNHITNYKHDDNKSNSIGSNDIDNIFLDSQDRIWIGAVNGGLNLFNKYNNDFFHFGYNKYSDRAINSKSVTRIVEDIYGNIWLTTHGGGINIISPYRNQFSHLKNDLSPYSLPHDYVSCFYEDKNGDIWIGTDGGGLCLFNKKDFTFENFKDNEGFLSNALLDICYAGENRIWIATWAGGLTLFDTQHKKVIKTYTANQKGTSISDNHIKSLFNDGKYLWIATHGDGLNVYDINKNEYINWRNNDRFNMDMRAPRWGNDVYFDTKQRLWIGSTAGLLMYNNDSLYSFNRLENDASSLSGYIVSCIYEDNKGNIWIGTEGGLNLYNQKQNSFIRINNSKLKVRIKSLQEDNKGNLWISSNSGLFRFDYNTNDLVVYRRHDGLQGDDFIDRASIKSNNGELFFGGVNGFNFFNPDNLIKNTQLPRVYLKDFKIYGQSQVPGNKESVLSQHISFTKDITISFNQSVITFEYIAINYMVPEKMQYAYMLQGFDKNWRNVGNERKANYTNLDPGEYTFMVKAANSEGIWNEEPAIVKLIITPPWWKELWFKISSIVMSILILATIYIARVRSIKAINKRLENEVAKRTMDIENANLELQKRNEKIAVQNAELIQQKEEIQSQKERISKQNEALEVKNKELLDLNKTKDKFFSIIAHDLKNPLNSIIGFSELIQHAKDISKDKIDKYVGIIFSSAKNLFGLLENLLNWARTQTGALKYNPQTIAVSGLIMENFTLLKSVAQSKDIQFNVELQDDYTVYADENMINTALRNLITNAIKFTNRGGSVTISAKKVNKNVEISIEDTGVGISEEIQKSLFKIDESITSVGTEKEIGTGLGLIISNEFIKKNNGDLLVESELAKGSKFTIVLPVVSK
ncbi:two-component regulator propeller domain-containing protein [Bacteroidota bacterium]